MLKRKYKPQGFNNEVTNLRFHINNFGEKLFVDSKKTKEEINEFDILYKKAVNHIKRASNLGGAKPNSGHDCALKGILINVNIEADQAFWLQWERYHHQDTISSMSTMHCLTKFEELDEMFSQYTDPRSIVILNDNIKTYNNNPTTDNFHRVVHSCPEGLELCRRVTLNYLQVKTMISQREHHKMYAWKHDFRRLSKELPYFNELVGITR
ncbi:MAG: hypothetical protein ACRCVJ_18625 [Clostridium sp.]|uniref:hypothetical protein n=1 Tax=Clostridium sp. TaxID=1506 RepID=UPI003F40403E